MWDRLVAGAIGNIATVYRRWTAAAIGYWLWAIGYGGELGEQRRDGPAKESNGGKRSAEHGGAEQE